MSVGSYSLYDLLGSHHVIMAWHGETQRQGGENKSFLRAEGQQPLVLPESDVLTEH